MNRSKKFDLVIEPFISKGGGVTPLLKGGTGVHGYKWCTINKWYFAIAGDSMGVQICRAGLFFPKFMDFETIENAEEYAKTHLSALAKWAKMANTRPV